ncbi:MAG: phosphate ABC transporter substrate-binding/OmpA family protein [Litoreibacter sp.]
MTSKKFTKRNSFAVALIAAGALGSSTATFAQSADEVTNVRVAGSDAMGLGFMPLLMEAYAAVRGEESVITDTDVAGQYTVDYIGEDGFGDKVEGHLVTTSSSSGAFDALLDGSAEIGMSSRRITRDEARALRSDGAGSMVDPNQEHIIAVDSIIVITHPENPVNTLSLRDLRDIYTGDIRNWSDLGGPDLPIVVVHRDLDSGTGATFNERILGAADATISKAAVRMTDDTSVAAIVNAEPSVIGFVGLAFQRGAQPVQLVNDCRITMTPDAFSARTEEYLLQRRLYLYNRGDTLNPEGTNFLDFVTSPEVDDVILKSGFVDLGVDRTEMPLGGTRGRALLNSDADPYESGFMRNMVTDMTQYDRLSTTFRFGTASSRLDERAQVDLERLTTYLASQPDAAEIKFVGFTDNAGEFDGNLALSSNRAEQVMNEVRTYAGDRLSDVSFASAGYGEIAPVGCNTSSDGRRVNRRVEVWIKK